MENFSDKLFNALKSSDPNEQIAALHKLQEDIVATPLRISAKTVESGLHMANTQLAYQMTIDDDDVFGRFKEDRFANGGTD